MSMNRIEWRSPLVKPREEGSLLVVIIFSVVILFFGVAFTVRAQGDLHQSGIVSNTNAARAMAMAGLSDALFRIDQQGTNNSSFCVGSAPQCTVASVPGAPSVQYAAKYLGATGNFSILSEGTVHNQTYTVQATIAQVPSFPFGIFAGSGVIFDGSGSGTTIALTQPDGTQTGLADVGSDGTITCHGSGTYGQNQVTYDGGNSNCPAWINEANSFTPQQPVNSCPAPVSVVPPPTPCMPSSNLATPLCPAGGNFTSPIEPGVYSCTGSITFSGTENVDYGSSFNNGKVQIYLWPNALGQSSIEMTGANVNQYDNYAGTCSGAGSFQCGDPRVMQVYAAGSGTVDVGAGSAAATFDGVLYAPGMSMTVNGGQLSWTGQFTLNQVVVNGNPNFSEHYDSRLGTIFQPSWQVQNFTGVSNSTFTLSLS